ncbi:MAG TPA: hypothetical protein VMN99_00870 [Anaerolineales bacterium]|nr:hypothetical protein [Anaerolineales bacterium]
MKKFIHLVILVSTLAGCSSLPSLPPLFASPTAPPPTETPTPFESATPLPTQNLFATSTPTPLTFTPTVTALGAELFTPTASETAFPTDFPTPNIPLDPSSSGYFTPQSIGFLAILISNNIIYWNAGPCTPRNIKVSAFVEDQINTHHVLLFTRLREKKNTLNLTAWNSGALMVKEENGSFNYNIRTFNLRRYYYYVDAWLEYQLVAFNEDREVIGRTPIYDRNLSLVRCQPIP